MHQTFTVVVVTGSQLMRSIKERSSTGRKKSLFYHALVSSVVTITPNKVFVVCDNNEDDTQ